MIDLFRTSQTVPQRRHQHAPATSTLTYFTLACLLAAGLVTGASILQEGLTNDAPAAATAQDIGRGGIGADRYVAIGGHFDERFVVEREASGSGRRRRGAERYTSLTGHDGRGLMVSIPLTGSVGRDEDGRVVGMLRNAPSDLRALLLREGADRAGLNVDVILVPGTTPGSPLVGGLLVATCAIVLGILAVSFFAPRRQAHSKGVLTDAVTN